jgi:hypothetical protein
VTYRADRAALVADVITVIEKVAALVRHTEPQRPVTSCERWPRRRTSTIRAT